MSFLDLTNLKVEARTPYSVLPDGTYIVRVDKAEVKDTVKAGGQMINVALKVTAGDHAGRLIFDSFNIKNASEQAQNIGLQHLKTMMECAGMGAVLETVSDLSGKVVAVKVGQEKKRDSEEMRNVIKSYLSMNAPGVETKSEVPWGM